MDNKIWYEDINSDKSTVISSRIRLARNLKKYPFSIKISEEDSKKLIQEVVSSIKNDYMSIGSDFEYHPLDSVADIDKIAMVENHDISLEMLKNRKPCGILENRVKSVNIMINEEDHIRIQTVFPGKDIERAWDMADKIDNLIEESLEYAFDKDFGYLTSCPSNTGTGLRASYMVHIPMLEKTGKIPGLITALSKFGMTIRGIYGEGSEPSGSIYQISNQVTLGKTEQEIIESLDNIANQITENENALLQEVLNTSPVYMEDSVYRALGLLKTARKMTMKEAMALLSAVRLGYNAGLIEEKRPDMSIYHIMMDTQPGNLQKRSGRILSEDERDILRAEYLRTIFAAL